MTSTALPSTIPGTLSARRRWTTFGRAIIFVAGFATFVVGLFGLVGTLLGDVLYDSKDAVRVVGGIAMIVFGLFTLHLIRIPILYSDTRGGLFNAAAKTTGLLQPYVMGLAFAAGWTPCIGPFLGAILSLSVTAETLGLRLALLLAYALGLGVPFLLVALLAERVTPTLRRLNRHLRTIEIISGLLLIGVGVLQLTGQMASWSTGLAQIAARSGVTLESLVLGQGTGAAPTLIIAVAAGFLSFASPCVLPLIPAYISLIGGYAVNNAASTSPSQ